MPYYGVRRFGVHDRLVAAGEAVGLRATRADERFPALSEVIMIAAHELQQS